MRNWSTPLKQGIDANVEYACSRPNGAINGYFLAFVALCFFVGLWSTLPLGDAVQFGEDEGYELVKGWLWSRGFSLYDQVWNDQPPVHTFILRILFALQGPTLLGARILALACASLLLLMVGCMVYETSGVIAATITSLFLVASPGFAGLSVSVMLEVPAFATGLCAAWLIFRWQRGSSGKWLWISGIVMGVALQTKLTAGILFPAILAQLLSGFRPLACKRRPFEFGRAFIIWAISVFIAFAAIGIPLGVIARIMLRSHFTSADAYAGVNPSQFQWSPTLLLSHPEGLFGTFIAVCVIFRRRQFIVMSFPLVLLVVCLGVHQLHRPYWGYYYLHFAIPISWLSGHGVAELIAWAQSGDFQTRWRRIAGRGFASAVCVCLLVAASARLESELQALQAAPRLETDHILKALAETSKSARWMYSENVIYNFHSGIPSPPQLAVTPLKRFWSGQLSQHEIVRCVKDLQVDRLLFCTGAQNAPEWRDLLATDYVRTYQKFPYVLFSSKKSKAQQW